jgi:hypothetical protein
MTGVIISDITPAYQAVNQPGETERGIDRCSGFAPDAGKIQPGVKGFQPVTVKQNLKSTAPVIGFPELVHSFVTAVVETDRPAFHFREMGDVGQAFRADYSDEIVMATDFPEVPDDLPDNSRIGY